MSQFDFRHGLYVSPRIPYIAVAVGIFVLAGGVYQIEMLGVYAYRVWQGQIPWSPSDVVWKLLTIVFQIALGGLIFLGGQRSLATKKEAKRLREQNQGRPWLCNKQWATGRIETEHRMVTLVFGVAMICLLALLVLCVRAMLLVPQADRSYWVVIALLILIYVVIRCYLLNRRWRQSELRLATIPGVIGGPLQAVVILNQAFPPGTAFRVTLRCQYVVWSFIGEYSSHNSKTCWQSDVVVDQFLETGIPGKTGIPVYFAIPFDCEATTPEDRTEQIEGSAIQWVLEVKRDDAGDFRSVQFKVPVFVTRESSPDYQEETNVLRQYSPAITADSVLAKMVYRCQATAGGQCLVFSLRRWSFVMVAFLVSLLCVAVLVAILSWLHPWPLVVITALVPASLLIICLLAMFEMLLWRSELIIQGEAVSVSAGYPGWFKRLSLTRDDTLVMDPQVEFTTSDSDFRCLQIQSAAATAARRAYFAAIENDEELDETLKPPPVVCVTVVKRIPGRQAAEAVRQWLEECIHGEHKSTDVALAHKQR